MKDEEVTKPWTYSPYRAMLRKDGEHFAIVTPDGRNALTPEDAKLLVDRLNDTEHLRTALEIIANYDGESIWNDSADDSRTGMLMTAQRALGMVDEDGYPIGDRS